MAKARALNPVICRLPKRRFCFAYEAGEYALMNSVYDELTDEQRAAPMVQAYHAFALAHTGRPEEALAILESRRRPGDPRFAGGRQLRAQRVYLYPADPGGP